MFDKSVQVSALQQAISSRFVPPGSNPGPVVELQVHSSATNAVLHLVIPNRVTVQGLVEAIVTDDQRHELIPPAMRDRAVVLVQRRTGQVLDLSAPLMSCNLQANENLDLRWTDHTFIPPASIPGAIPRPDSSLGESKDVPPFQLFGWRPEIIIMGGIILLLGITLLFFVLVRLWPGNDEPTRVHLVITPSLEQRESENSKPTETVPTLTPAINRSAADLKVTLIPNFEHGGSGSIQFQVTGGAKPYTCWVNGQQIDRDVYLFRWVCEQRFELTYQVLSSDGQKVGPNQMFVQAPECKVYLPIMLNDYKIRYR